MTFYTAEQVATILGVSKRRVLHLIEAGRLKAQKFGPMYMISSDAVEAVRVRKNGRPRKAEARAQN